MMNKLLHERLREHEYRTKCTGRMFADIIGCEEPECIGIDCIDCIATFLDKLADEIERYYIPRPRFEDGEPICWHETDIAWDNGKPYKFNAVTVGGRPLAYAGDEIYAEAELNDEGFVKRSQPKVLGADGKEIKVGDDGWYISYFPRVSHSQVKILEVDQDNGRLLVRENDGSTYYMAIEKFTHKEPDSLEKLLDDIIAKYDDNGIIYLGQVIDRLSALIERGA